MNNTQKSIVVAIVIAAVALVVKIIFGETFYNVYLGWGMTLATVIMIAVGIFMDVYNSRNK